MDSKTKEYKLNKIRDMFNDYGYELLDKEYVINGKNKPAYFTCFCSEHNFTCKVRISQFRKSFKLECCKLGKTIVGRAYTLESVKEICFSKSIEFLDDSYSRATDNHRFKCLIHGFEFITKFSIVKNGKLKCCVGPGGRNFDLHKNDISRIKEICLSFGFEYMSETYDGRNKKVDVRCLKHGFIGKQCFAQISCGVGMKCCGIEKSSGENNHNYQREKTEDQRARDRHMLGEDYKGWRKVVYQRDSYKCQLCGNGGKLNAHHLNNYWDYPEVRLDINNGISLCEWCHRDFHHIFGVKHTDKNQFEFYRNVIGDSHV